LRPQGYGPIALNYLTAPLSYRYSDVQVRIKSVNLGGAISVVFGSQVSLRLHYYEKDEVCFTTLLWQTNGRQNGLISRMLFSELYKNLMKKVIFVGFRGEVCLHFGKVTAKELYFTILTNVC